MQMHKKNMLKYNEDIYLDEVKQYIENTYSQHYVNEKNNIHGIDFIESIGDSEGFCRGNAIKYLSRYGRKNGKNRLDLLKAIHYIVLLDHFSKDKK